MKVLLLLAGVFGICCWAEAAEETGTTTTFKCPQSYKLPPKPIVLTQFLGNWFITHTSPCDQGHAEPGHDHKEEPECMSQLLWRAKGTPEGEVSTVCSQRQSNGTYFFSQGFGKAKASPMPDQFEAQFDWEFKLEDKKNMKLKSVFVESDEGQSWGIGHTCIVDEKSGNVTSIWAVLSRSPKMDPKLEYDLTQKVVKYSGLTHDKILGVRQTGCYDVPKKIN